jgi:branched-chain amino acid transport system substrate-binding protein
MTGPAYAAIQIIADAIERAGTLDTAKIRDAIAATDMMTVTGPVKFNPDGTNRTSLGPLAQWQNGKQELVFPLDLATKPLIYPIPKWSER